jgi:hypothetical protein
MKQCCVSGPPRSVNICTDQNPELDQDPDIVPEHSIIKQKK